MSMLGFPQNGAISALPQRKPVPTQISSPRALHAFSGTQPRAHNLHAPHRSDTDRRCGEIGPICTSCPSKILSMKRPGHVQATRVQAPECRSHAARVAGKLSLLNCNSIVSVPAELHFLTRSLVVEHEAILSISRSFKSTCAPSPPLVFPARANLFSSPSWHTSCRRCPRDRSMLDSRVCVTAFEGMWRTSMSTMSGSIHATGISHT